ncbi:YhgE/Pip family protein [Candidatus Nanosynbacter featherlites]|uniref:YhgE/Pip domain-containing protein n=1 Tax=Candidatus Nanosynbacter featherlites TaxID=2572088 RepID=A0A4P9A2D7_9BACT|nr:YhgE/Pip domain-containing protein [Candidatus Nanosynbacter featherlites]QCT41935.1 YhgE/Pip domain-containing protein [Candidatus Nanosynbacter featherlites]
MVEKLKRLSNRRRANMVRAEWQHLCKNKILLLSMAVISFIPIMYSGFFLGSIWDPYGQVKNLPVAFVNEDKGAQLNGQTANIGQSVEQKLKSNHDLGWEFVNKQQADDGVNSGHFYAVVTVPTDFSAKAASITAAQPQQAVIRYTTTPAKNYIGSLVSNQAAEKVKTSMAEQITQAYAKGVLENVGKLGSGLETAAGGAATLHDGLTQLQAGAQTYTGGVKQLAVNQRAMANGLARLGDGSRQLQAGLGQLSNGLPSESQVAQLTNGMKQLQAGLNQLNTSVHNPSPTLVNQQSKVQSEARDLMQTMQTAAADLTAAGGTLQTLGASAASSGGSTTITLPQIGQLSQALSKTQIITTQAAALLKDLQTLTQSLSTQQAQLQTGISTLNNGVNQLAPNATAALNGYNSVRVANNQLLAGSSSLANGLAQAQTGSQQLANGAGLLDSRSGVLTNGASQLAGGADTLATKLADASRQLKIQPTGAATQQQMANPVKSETTKQGDVPNYGYALAPYVLSLSLFVGAIALNIIYPIRKTFAEQENAFRWWLAKASVTGMAAFVQATILMLIMVYCLGLVPDHPGHFIGAIYLTSFVYMSIVSLLVIVLDNPGRFLAMVLLVLQLGSSEGTFPIQTANGFFQAVNPLVPMTYSIRALRQAISGGLGSSFYDNGMWVLAGFLLAANLLTIGFFIYRGKRKFAHTSVDGDD